MPILGKVGRKSLPARFITVLLHTALILGAVTTVYPFLLMLGTSLTGSTDSNEFLIIPRYLYEEKALFAKYVEEKYAGDIETVNRLYHTTFLRMQDVVPPTDVNTEKTTQTVRIWQQFKHTLPISAFRVGFRSFGLHPGKMKSAYVDALRSSFHNDISQLNPAYAEDHESFDTVDPPQERPESRTWAPDTSRKTTDFLDWKKTLPDNWLILVSVDSLFAKYLKEDVPLYGGDIQKAAPIWGNHRSFDEIPLPTAMPQTPQQRKDWERFVRTKLPFRYLDLPPEALPTYHAFLKNRYHTIDKFNATYHLQFRTFDEVALPSPSKLPETGALVRDFGEFISTAIPTEMLRLNTAEHLYRLSFQSNSATQANGNPPFFVPCYQEDALYVHQNTSSLRRDFATRNYRIVADYLLLHGHALWVTAIFCLVMILTTLTVNPLCAYALSRFRLPYASNILLFLLATMAFPAEVAMIPNFLLLKELGLLNTYWALVLPGAASGFSIFLLKGFFDSLPKELYEAGTIDGASETRMLWQITLPLSGPIFAVIALEAFVAAYGAFLFALIVCQNPRMWTVMVWLYQLQTNSPPYVMMAALTMASLPTLLLFVFAQNVILRGTILPTEK